MSPSYGHAYLTSYGWTGTGTGLRNGAIDKPLAIPQKKNLSGLGKDRDEAFPFWDHLFAAASKTITIKLADDDDDDDDEPIDTDPFHRTTTGILSNRRPVSGTPASAPSGSTTPARPTSLLAAAKREAARRSLYARFFRGPVLGPDVIPTSSSEEPESIEPEPEANGISKKSGRETKEERRERKRLKRERKATRAAKRAQKASPQVDNDVDAKKKKYPTLLDTHAHACKSKS